MSTHPEKTALITGANAGLGKEVARQLALRPEFGGSTWRAGTETGRQRQRPNSKQRPAGASSTSFSWTSPIWVRCTLALRPSTDPSTRWS